MTARWSATGNVDDVDDLDLGMTVAPGGLCQIDARHARQIALADVRVEMPLRLLWMRTDSMQRREYDASAAKPADVMPFR